MIYTWISVLAALRELDIEGYLEDHPRSFGASCELQVRVKDIESSQQISAT